MNDLDLIVADTLEALRNRGWDLYAIGGDEKLFNDLRDSLAEAME